jgi:hypothetical protein
VICRRRSRLPVPAGVFGKGAIEFDIVEAGVIDDVDVPWQTGAKVGAEDFDIDGFAELGDDEAEAALGGGGEP